CASYSVVLAGCGLRSRRVSAHDPATTVIYTLSLHDALPILRNPKYFSPPPAVRRRARRIPGFRSGWAAPDAARACEWRHRNATRSEEHTSELQSRENLVCRLLLEKKKRHQEAKVPVTWSAAD